MVNFGGQHDTSVLQKLNAYVMVPDQLEGPLGDVALQVHKDILG